MHFSARAALGGLAALVAVSVAIGHPDDPKQWDIQPPYVGPGYRADVPGSKAGIEFPAVAVELRAWLPVGDFGPEHSWANDCWGYTAPSGREYAIIGLSDGTGFVEITDPGNPVIVEVIPGPRGIWRDIKVFQDYAYAVSEDGAGIQVIPLADIDNGNVGPATSITTGGSAATHNVALNTDSGYLYRCGGSGHGLRIYDLNPDPAAPEYAATWDDKYVHDAQIVSYTSGPWAGREIAFCCAGFNGGGTQTGLTILDVTAKDNIFETAPHLQYPNGAYSHQGWLSADRHYFYLDDEQDEGSFNLNSTTHVIDVSDLTAPAYAGSFANGSPAITHNLYTLGNLIFEANYTSGLRVFDTTDPLDPAEIGFFDTRPEDEVKSYNGLWSNYPYFPSGTIIGSDREKGLFVWELGTVPLAFSYPEGLPDMLAAQGASIAVQIDELGEDPLDPATATLHYDDGGGYETVAMTDVGGGAFDAAFPDLECAADASYYFSAQSVGGTTVTDPPAAPASAHQALVASVIAVILDDDFETDMGWTPVNAGATDGDWERGVPVDDPAWPYDPAADADGSGQCWLTANTLGDSDVDGGFVQLFSPQLDLSAGNVGLSYEYFARLTVANGFDGLRVEASSNGDAGPWIELARHIADGGLDWHHVEFTPGEIEATGVALTDSMVLRFTGADGDPESIVEIGLDAFRLLEVQCGVPGDTDGDGVVGVEDFLFLLGNWGPCPGPCPPSCPADFDGDCEVGIGDFLILLGSWT